MSRADRKIRVVFLGSPEFAVPSLHALAESGDIDVTLVVTQPDRRAGRGKKLTPPPVKSAAEMLGLPVIQPETLRDRAVITQLEEHEPDLLVVVSYGEILRKRLLELAPAGCINVHPSLLPCYRGSLPIQSTILNGDTSGGVSVIKLIKEMDAGPIVHQIPVDLTGRETTGELFDQLSKLAADSLPDVIRDWVAGDIDAREQDHEAATYTRELRKADAQINWSWSAVEIDRFVRAMHPWPKAWTTLDGQRFGIDSVSVTDQNPDSSEPGMITESDNWPAVSTGQGKVRLDRLTPAGKKPQAGDEWFRGARGFEGKCFDQRVEPLEPLIFTRPHGTDTKKQVT
jgi:methionyl-tRNA formyltransferase